MEEQKKLNKDQLKVVALTQRIGEITSEYESKIADMRVAFTEEIDRMQEISNAQLEELIKLKDAQNAEAQDSVSSD